MTQLSEHFSLAEFTRSETADRMGNDNEPTAEHLANMKKYLAPGMELVREVCGGRRIFVSSAYRNPVVNKAVGGVSTSAHAKGLACDFLVMGITLQRAAALILASGMKFDQLIHESSRGILHISFDAGHKAGLRQQILTQAGPAGSDITKGIMV